MKSQFDLFRESLKTVRVSKKDHHHFTNLCLMCHGPCDDSDMVPCTIERRSGPDMRLYIELDYICKHCLVKLEL
jgi:hypothetical protein